MILRSKKPLAPEHELSTAMRCSEPGESVAVAIECPRGPRRLAR